MISLQDTLKLNNYAVALYQSGDITQASKAFSPKSHSTTSTPTVDPFVYQSLLILRESQAASSSLPHDEMQLMTLYCACILFNTAILHHQESIKTGSSACLDRAAQLYEASIRLVGKFPTTVASFNNNTISLLALAASNNLAQIEFQKGLLDQASTRLQVLKHLIQSLQHVVLHIFTVDEFDGMLSNSLSAEGVIASSAA
ncbi:unnamed protein product [Cylindrotheca closterium]|uniref:Uncharacterized protein n=1 Tax=Cylindrotheca closterium TaxID=2856 RepID=A0AAD2JGG6_9STRA|nr:unnamed protein product [Cylindrotheca closterium]